MLLVWLSAAHATMPDAFGLGARWQAMGGGSVAMVDDGTSAIVNPAGLAGAPTLAAGIGLFTGQPRVEAVPAVNWDTNRDGSIDDRDEPLAWDATPPRVQALDMQMAGPVGKYVHVGMSLTVPTNTLIRFATFDPQLPTYARWANRTQRTHLALGLAASPIRGLRIGAAVDVLAQGVATVRMTLDARASADEGTTQAILDVHAIDLKVVPTWAPVLGMQFDAGTLHPVLEGLSLGARYHAQVGLPLDVDLDAQANVRVEDLGDTEPYEAALVATADLALFDHYIPHQIDVGLGYARGETLRVHADLRWGDWRGLTLNVAQVNRAAILAPLIGEVDDVGDGNPYAVTARSTVGLRTGVELSLPSWTLPGPVDRLQVRLRGGFMLDPSPIVDQGPESAILDSDHRVGTMGIGLDLGVPEKGQAPFSLDAMLQVHSLASGRLNRPPAPGVRGAPATAGGIPIGGSFLAGGAQLRFVPALLQR